MNNLTKMPNIGKTLADCLIEVDINSAQELKEIGSKEAFVRLKLRDADSCYNKLCALEGAIQGIRWHHLSSETKEDLKSFFSNF